ncbi:MAG: 23S rRNA (guanosine(2251)-2'-O)-methyltransferase RlmB [Campylobacterota bacterium]
MIIYGKQCCEYMLKNDKAFHKIYLSKKTVLDNKTFAKYRDKIDIIDNKKAQGFSRGGNHQGILMEVDEFEPVDFKQIKSASFIVILNEITDVGNIGAIIRTAYSLGADAVIATGVRSLNYAAIARSSSAALFELDFAVEFNIFDVLNELKQTGFTTYGATTDATTIEQVQFAQKVALVLGSEGKGISGKILKKLDHKVAVKMHRPFDSLNVSVAAGIIINRIANDNTRVD